MACCACGAGHSHANVVDEHGQDGASAQNDGSLTHGAVEPRVDADAGGADDTSDEDIDATFDI